MDNRLFDMMDKMAQGPIPVPPTPRVPPATTPGNAVPNDLLDILRACPHEHVPPSPETPANTSTVQTHLGTPRARTWDDAWMATVDAAEARIGRRICGARTIAGNPCELGSTHPSGRCRFHGGFDLTGAPRGNRYAYLHGLYSRRLKTCGAHCPQWSECPCAGADLDNVPLPERPVCPFEQDQYNAALADALDRAAAVGRPDPFHVHIAHNVALFQVMLGRAAAELRNQPASGQTDSAAAPNLLAMGRIAAELRKSLALLDKSAPLDTATDLYQRRRRELRNSDSGLAPEYFDTLPPDEKETALHRQRQAEEKARDALTRAVAHAAEGRAQEAIEQWRAASRADRSFTNRWTAGLRKKIRDCPASRAP